MAVQLQVISKILACKSIDILKDNNITKEYFTEYPDEIEFILDNVKNYGTVPDEVSFLAKFDDIDLVEVNETDRYLVDTLREEYLYARFQPVIQQAAKLLKADANEASKYLQTKLPDLAPNYTTPTVDIAHSNSRLDLFRDKAEHTDKWFIPSGFEELDDIIYGWQMGEEYVVIFARTGQGKSWILVKIAEHAFQLGKNVGYISPEMSADKIGYRFDTLHNNFSNLGLVRGDMTRVEDSEYEEYINKLGENKNSFNVSTPKDFNQEITVSKLRAFIKANNLDMLAIDGITYMTDERYKRGDNKTTQLTNISEDLMQLSCELRIPILVVVQSNRGGVDKDTPDLEDIRDSDGISHNATKVISLRQKGDGLIMHIKKNRDGRVGDKICYLWDIDTGTFNYVESLDEKENDDVPDMPIHKKKNDDKQKKKVVF